MVRQVSSPRVAARWPHIWPRSPQEAPKTGQDSPKMAIDTPTMAQEGLLKRRCHNNLNLTSPTSYFLHTSRTKTQFSSPPMAPRWPHIWPRSPQEAPKTGQDSPQTAIDTPAMAQETFLKRRCHINLKVASSTSHLLHTSPAKTPFSSCQDGPKTPPDAPQMAPRQAKVAPK